MASPFSDKEGPAVGSPTLPGDGEALSPESDSRRLTRSAGVVSLAVMISRVLGLVREQVLAYLLPAKGELDAFYGAFRIPNLLRDLFGEGALSKSFISCFSEIEEKEGREPALRLANNVLNVLVLLMSVLTVLGMVYAEPLVDAIFSGEGFDVVLPSAAIYGIATKRELTVLLTRVMFPFILLVSVAALVMGILNARGRFFVPALASSFFNAGSVVVGVAGFYLAPRYGVHPTVGLAVGVLAGGAFQLAWQLPTLYRLGYRYRATLEPRDPWLGKVARLFGPAAIVASTVQVNVLVNSYFASRGEGWLAWITQSFRILHLPIGLVGVAVSTATLPALSRAAAQKNTELFRSTFSHATRLVLFFTVPATVGLLVLASPIVRLIFEQGAFGPDDTVQVAGALRGYAIGLISFTAVKIVTDGFYALQDVRAPMIVSLASMAVNAFLNWLFVVHLGLDHRGLALGTSATTTVSLVGLWLLFRKRSRLGRLDGRRSLGTFLKTGSASLLMGTVAFAAFRSLDSAFGHDVLWARLLQVATPIAAALVVYFVGCRTLGVSELDDALSAVWPRRHGPIRIP